MHDKPQSTQNLSAGLEDLPGWATVVADSRPVGDAYVLTVEMPGNFAPGPVSGHFFQIRCGVETESERFSTWNDYVPCTVFAVDCRPAGPAQQQADIPAADAPAVDASSTGRTSEQSIMRWTLLLNSRDQTGISWLLRRGIGDRILCFGPFGNRLPRLASDARPNLLVIADSTRVLALLSALHATLDQGGRVTIMLLESAQTDALRRTMAAVLPLAVEIQEVKEFIPSSHLTEVLRWADVALTCVRNVHIPQIGYLLRTARFQTSSPRRRQSADREEFAYALIEADFLCGYGACLACAVPTANGGVTRACMHGPIIPYSTLAG